MIFFISCEIHAKCKICVQAVPWHSERWSLPYSSAVVLLYLWVISICPYAADTPVCCSVRFSAQSLSLTVQQTGTMLLLHLLTHSLLLIKRSDYSSAMVAEWGANSPPLPPFSYPSRLCWQEKQPSSVCWQDIMGPCGLVSCCDWQRLLKARCQYNIL